MGSNPILSAIFSRVRLRATVRSYQKADFTSVQDNFEKLGAIVRFQGNEI